MDEIVGGFQMAILVTGGAGFIGSHVCDALLGKGHSVICVDDFNDYYSPKIKENNIKACLKNARFCLYQEDIRNFDKVKRIFKERKIHKIIHLAARTGVRASVKAPLLYAQVNIGGTLNLLELAKQFGVKDFIFGSSSSVYGLNKNIPFSEENDTLPISPYAATKKAGEQLCYCYHHLYGMNVICLRFFTVYGPRGRPDMAMYKFTKLISEDEEIEMFGDGTSKRDYTYITDIVSGILSALDKNLGFEIINLGNNQAVELRYFISLIEKELGKKARIKRMPMQKGDVPLTYADISKAKRILGYEPKVGIKEGVKRFVEWFKNEKE